MPTEQVLTDAVDRAVRTATIDPDAPREPRDERCQFDREALATVIGFCDSGRNRDVVIEVVERALQRWVEGLDADRVLAAVMLRERIAGATARRTLVVEDIEGNVGTGRGPA
jgi:hypothetical protein